MPTESASPSLCLLRFLVSQQALLLFFSDGTVQVSMGPRPQGPLGVSGLAAASLSPGPCWLFQCTLSGAGLQETAGSWHWGKVLTPNFKNCKI